MMRAAIKALRRKCPPPEGAGGGSRTAAANPRGFMLLEVLVSIVILGMTVILFIQLFAADLKAVAGSERLFNAAVSAESRLKELAADEKLAENSWVETDAAGRRVVISVREVLQDRTSSLRLRMLEVSLNIYWMSGGREKTLGLKTIKAVRKPDSEQEQPWDEPGRAGPYGDA